MGCQPAGNKAFCYFCTSSIPFDSAVGYLKKGYINDVKGELYAEMKFPVERIEVPNAPVSYSGLPLIIIRKNKQDEYKIVGKSEVLVSFDIPVLGPAPTCKPDFPIITAKQYNRSLASQQNYIVQSRYYGLWYYSSSNDDGKVAFQAQPCEVDMLIAYNHAEKNNLWGQEFYLNMEYKAGALFQMHNPACAYKNGTYSFDDKGMLILKYKMINIPVRIIALN